ncbi:MAG: recombination regulator RecX [Rhabdochlamydiaceae bacterium]|jgi:SOS response regulatory protein OraA/RecX
MENKEVKKIALRLLSIRSYSSLELIKKLNLRGFAEAEVAWAVEECKRLGFLNDEGEAERRTERFKRKGYGPGLIAYKMKSAGLKEKRLSVEDQKEAIRELLKKEAWKKKDRIKKMAALQRRGFDMHCILAVIS